MDKFGLKETKKKKDPHLAVHITAKYWKGTITNVINCLNFCIIQRVFHIFFCKIYLKIPALFFYFFSASDSL